VRLGSSVVLLLWVRVRVRTCSFLSAFVVADAIVVVAAVVVGKQDVKKVWCGRPLSDERLWQPPLDIGCLPIVFMDSWKIVLLGDGGVGKTALAV